MAVLTLFYSPFACSLSCHIALEESGLAYTLAEVNTSRGDNRSAAYLAINPLGKVPALAFDGQVLTEAAAILGYIADLLPDKALLPAPRTVARARAQEWLNFLSSTVHIAFRPVLRPERMVTNAGCVDDIRRIGISNVIDALQEANRRLSGRPVALGDRFSLCDGYLPVFYLWSRRDLLRAHMPPLPALRATARRALDRPSVQEAFRKEGLSAPTDL
jgi:glutathione S-transferase